jgi:hypothetical protein
MTATGIFPGMGWGEYRAHPALNVSRLLEMGTSPLEYHWRLDHPQPDKPHFKKGRAFHTAFLEPELFEQSFIRSEYDAFRSNEAKAWRDEQEAGGKTVLSAADYGNALACASALRKRRNFKMMLEEWSPVFEASIITPSGRKGRTDMLCQQHSAMMDLKTTSARMTQGDWAREVSKWSYHIRAAWYFLIASEVVPGVQWKHFFHLVVSTEAPYPAAIFRLEDDAIAQGGQEILALLDLLKRCQDSGRYPDRSETVLPVGLPAWHRPEFCSPPKPSFIQPVQPYPFKRPL